MKKLLNHTIKDLTLFKIVIIVILTIFLLKLNDISKNGRYLPFDKDTIIDTRTGNVYELKEDDKYIFDKPHIPKSFRK